MVPYKWTILTLWMTSETLLHIERKRHAWNKYLATNRTEDFEKHKHDKT